MAPGTPVEEVLCRVWARGAAAERVGVDDSFFVLGGDSILSIQVVARAREAGLHLMPRDIFEHPTVSELARHVSAVGPAERPAARRTERPAALTPVQCWFFEQDVPARHRWTCRWRCRRPRPGDVPALEAALRAGSWPISAPCACGSAGLEGSGCGGRSRGSAGPLTRVDLSGLAVASRSREVERRGAEVQVSLELERATCCGAGVCSGATASPAAAGGAPPGGGRSLLARPPGGLADGVRAARAAGCRSAPVHRLVRHLGGAPPGAGPLRAVEGESGRTGGTAAGCRPRAPRRLPGGRTARRRAAGCGSR